MDLFDTLTWAKILVKTTLLGIPTLIVPIFGSLLVQYKTKLVGLGIKLMATRRGIQWNHNQLLVIKIEYTMNDF